MEVLLLEQAGQRYAVDASWVSEIVEPARVTPLPFAPAWVEGLVDIAGQVLVQIDLGCRLGLPAAAGAGSVLVLQVGGERLSARVERVLSKIELPAGQLVALDADGEASWVSGEFAWEGQVALCLAAAAFALEELEQVADDDTDAGSHQEAAVIPEQATTEADNDEMACLFFRSTGETYALKLADVAEVLGGEALTPVPQAPAEVAGMLLLRGTPLLVLSLPALLGRPDDGPATSLAVVERQGMRLILGVGPVLGIERFGANGIQALPQIEAGLSGFVVSPRHGLSGLISLSTLLPPERMEIYGKFMAQQSCPSGLQARAGDGNVSRLLTFRAGGERCALPLEQVQRVAEAEEEAVDPGADGTLGGVALIHGEVLPVVDLISALDGDAARRNAEAATYLVVNAEGGTWALKVDKVERVINLHERDIEPVRADAGDWIGAVGKLDGQLLSIVHLHPLRQAA